MRQVFFTTATLCLAATVLSTSWAVAQPCACPTTRPPQVALAESDAVFEAQVTGVREGDYVSGTSENAPGRWVTLLVIREWKGATAGTTRHVFTPALCGVAFEAGTAWLVYARHAGSSHELRTTRCNRTRPITESREDLLGLGIPGTQILSQQGSAVGPRRPRIARPAAPIRRGRRVIIRRRVRRR